jgi:hypothetical protein
MKLSNYSYNAQAPPGMARSAGACTMAPPRRGSKSTTRNAADETQLELRLPAYCAQQARTSLHIRSAATQHLSDGLCIVYAMAGVWHQFAVRQMR